MVGSHITAGGAPLSVEGAILLATIFPSSADGFDGVRGIKTEILTCIRIQVKYDDFLPGCAWDVIPTRVADTGAFEVVG